MLAPWFSRRPRGYPSSHSVRTRKSRTGRPPSSRVNPLTRRFAADPPDSIIVGEFWGNERYGRLPHDKSHIPFTCGATGKAYTAAEMRERYELLARSLAKRTGWSPNEETPWDKVVGIFAYNSVRLPTPQAGLCCRRHRQA